MLQTTAGWDEFVRAHPRGHILQTSAWGRLKADYRLASRNGSGGPAGALVLFRRVRGLTLAYVPRGPLADWNDHAATVCTGGRPRRRLPPAEAPSA